MKAVQAILNKPFVKIGALLGFAFILAQYFFYFGGRSIIMNKTFDSTIELLIIMGLYLGLSHCKRLAPNAGFGKIFLWGFLITLISVSLRVIFSMLLYGVLVPELGADYKKVIIEQMSKILENNSSLLASQYKEVSAVMINSFTLPILEGVGLLFSGIVFSLFIAALLNMFRK